MTVAYVGGTFDLFHVGHVRLLKKCRENFDIVSVALNTDDFNFRYKKRYPVFPLQQRAEIVRACEYVDHVYVNWSGEDSKPTILRAKATHIIHGDDWPIDSLMKQLGVTNQWLRENNIVIQYFASTSGISTTDLLARIYQTLHSSGGRPADADVFGELSLQSQKLKDSSSGGDKSISGNT